MEKKKITLSVALAVFNEEKNLRACLASIADIADEIVVVDGGSIDNTLAIAEEFKSVVIKTDNPSMFHINKQKALDACNGVWILQLDADEIITDELKKEILTAISTDTKGIVGYFIPRSNYFWGHFMKKGGQYPDSVIRLIKKGYARFPCKSVHEQIEVDGDVKTLVNPMQHYSYRSRSDYWKKANTYTSLTAKELQKDHGNSLTSKISLFIQYVLIKPVLTFLLIYVRHKGFMDGLVGFEFALYSGLHFSTAYIKYLNL